MALINRSSNLYGASPAADAAIDCIIKLGGDFVCEAYNPNVDCEFDGVLDLGGDFLSQAHTPGDDVINANLILGGDFSCETALVLQPPAPITNTVSETAFQNQKYTARLYVNNQIVPFISAEIIAPAGSLGKSLSINLAIAELSQLPINATFKFQIGKIVAGNPIWSTLLDGGKLSGRQFQMSVGRNSLSFSTFETDSKLNKYPRNNLIVFDQAKANVSADEIEPLYTNTNEVITTTARSVSVLTLKKLLNIAFVEGCGFSSVSTDIPNYEIARCDFSVVNSYSQAVAQFIGMYEPVMSVQGNTLVIQKTVDPLPSGYEPNRIASVRYPSFTENLQNSDSKLDGYILNYTATAGSFYVDRNLPDKTIRSGTFGTDDYTETTISRKVRDWFETGNPVAVRTEDKQETRTTRRNGTIIGRETRTNLFDKLGRASGYTNTIETRLPDVANNGLPALLKTSENTQKISYKTNPFSPRQTILERVENSSKALLAIDSENTALDSNGEDSPYGKNYEKVFEAGNMTKQMTSAFQTLETTTEHYRPLSNGQIEVRTETFDALRGIMKNGNTEFRTGDISIQNFTKQKTKTIFRPGVTQANRTGRPEPLNVGELPLYFAEPLALWLLQNPRITGSIELAGYDESIERGVSFNLRDRNDADLGNFITRGFRIRVEPQQITTSLEALKV